MKRSVLGNMRHLLVALLAVGLFIPCVNAQEPPIISAITEGGTIIIEQPRGLDGRLTGAKAINPRHDVSPSVAETPAASTPETETETSTVTGTTKSAGYRVQVFSDNNARTAKAEARAKSQAISQRLPYATYVVYQSPYWRLKVGDFPTVSEAENAADEIKKLFPAYAREVRVIKDRINR